ncbi:MAG: DUF177 domain-containing protein [Pseudomonadota bacterium]|nr:DUF177 domain-containing protein [Pseudomonadota bacterium]
MTEMPRPLALDRIGALLFEQKIEARPDELEPLARRMGVPAVHRLACSFRLRRVGASVIEAEGVLSAEVVQVCVVSLDEFTQAVEDRFSLQFVPEGAEAPDDDLEAPDQITYDSSAIDLGETAAQQLALALDPYPHKPGAEEFPDEITGPANPFAALAARRRTQ